MPNQHSCDSDNLSGQTVGKWLVGERFIKNKTSYYHCVCVCGSKQDIAINNLKGKRSNQCRACRSLGRIRTICVRGHDTSICGRTPGSRCRGCAREDSLMRLYGITFAEYEALFNMQGGKCAICGRKLDLVKSTVVGDIKNGRAETDHKHLSKKEAKKVTKKSMVRGILCGGRWAGCNHRLGKIDNIEWLRSAAYYLENPPAHKLFQRK